MKKKMEMTLLLVSIVTSISVSTAACGRDHMTSEDVRQSMDEENRRARDNTIMIEGSTSMEQFANLAAEGFMEKYPEMTVTVQFTGSSAGVEAVLAGRADIGNSSRKLREKEKISGAVEHIVALDGIAVITDTGNEVRSLTTEQLSGLYTGEIRNWQEVGGSDLPVVPVGREAGSGTRSTFEELLGIRDLCSYANELDSAGAVMARVIMTPGAVGYVSFEMLDDRVYALSIDGVEATEENVTKGIYRLWQPCIMVTEGEIGIQKEAVQRFLLYLWSAEGRKLIRSVGLIVPDS